MNYHYHHHHRHTHARTHARKTNSLEHSRTVALVFDPTQNNFVQNPSDVPMHFSFDVVLNGTQYTFCALYLSKDRALVSIDLPGMLQTLCRNEAMKLTGPRKQASFSMGGFKIVLRLDDSLAYTINVTLTTDIEKDAVPSSSGTKNKQTKSTTDASQSDAVDKAEKKKSKKGKSKDAKTLDGRKFEKEKSAKNNEVCKSTRLHINVLRTRSIDSFGTFLKDKNSSCEIQSTIKICEEKCH